MLRKVSGIGAVLAHVCQVLVPKVVHLEVILGGLLGVALGVSWRSIWRCLGCGFGDILGVILWSLGSLLEVDLELVEVRRVWLSFDVAKGR